MIKNLSSMLAALAGESFGARFLKTFAIPLGVAVAVGWAIASFAEPMWVAPGWSYYHGYGKNVEVWAVVGGLAAGAGAVLLSRLSGLYLLICPVGFLGIGVAAFHFRGQAAEVASTGSLLIIVAAVLLFLFTEEKQWPSEQERESSWWLHGLCVLVLAVLAFLVNQRTFSEIDTYHMGKVLLAALDLSNGGVPFKTFFWPYGLHDAGLVALWTAVTGKIGTSPVALAYSSQVAIGAVGLYMLGYRILRSIPLAFAVTALGLILGLLLGVNPNELFERRLEGFLAIQPPGSFHVWFFVILAFCIVTAECRLRYFLAGVALGISQLWRIEIGAYGVVALAGILAYRDFVSGTQSGRAWIERCSSFLRHSCSLLAGLAVLLGLAYLVLGWPNLSWYDVVLRVFPRYFVDLTGLPFPTVLGLHASAGSGLIVDAYGSLVLIMFLFFLSTYVVQHDYLSGKEQRSDSGGKKRGQVVEVLVFLGLIGTLSLKTALGRSDLPHVFFSTPLLVIGSLFLVASLAKTRFGWTALKTYLVLATVMVLVNPRKVEIRLPRPVPPWERVAQSINVLGEHLAPNPAVGDCDNRLYTPSESRAPKVLALIEATCKFEQLLRKNDIKRFVVDHSAPWYYLRFGVLPPPTQHYPLDVAITLEWQLRLIEDLRKDPPQALLKVKGFGAIRRFDEVPNGVRNPIVEAYLQGQSKSIKPMTTDIGDLYIFDNPRYQLDPPPSLPFSPVTPANASNSIHVEVDLLVYAPSGFLSGNGWAVERRGSWVESRPLAKLFLFKDGALVGEFTYGLPRPDVARVLQNKSLARAGWSADLLLPSADIENGELGVRALFEDGSFVDSVLDTTKLRRLPELTGKEWSRLPSAVSRAQQLSKRSLIPKQGRP